MKLLLCGPPGVGKTTVATLAAEFLGWQMVDTDHFFVNTYGKVCYELYHELGEETFRAFEEKFFTQLHPLKDAVIALGGGILSPPCKGMVMYLRASYTILLKRLEKRPKMPAYLDPQHPQQSYINRIAKRIPLYEAMADLTIDTDHLQPKDIAESIVRRLHGK